MPTYTPQALWPKLQQKQYDLVYFLQGEENYYTDLFLQHFANQILTESEKTFNLTILYGKETNIGQIVRQAQQYPFGASHQVVLVKEAQELSELSREAGQKILESYLCHPTPTTILVFGYKHKVLAAKNSLAKALAQKATLVTSKCLYDNQVAQWIQTYVKGHKHTITDESIALLQTFVGNDLTRLAKELDKIFLTQPSETCITHEVVQAQVGISKKFHAFELQNALATRNIYAANQLIFQLLAPSKSQVAIPCVALLYGFFSKVLICHQYANHPPETLVEHLQINRYFLNQYRTAKKQYPLSKVLENIEHLLAADLQLKGISYAFSGEAEILKELVFKLVH